MRSKRARRGWFGAKPVHDLKTGQSFDSRSEYSRWQTLELLQRAGEISELTLHPKVVLIERKEGAPEIAWHPDYRYTEAGRTVWEDSKARQRDGQRLRLTSGEALLLKLWMHFGPGLLRITGARGAVLRTVMPNAGIERPMKPQKEV